MSRPLADGPMLPRRHWLALAVISIFLAAFATLSWLAVIRQSVTYDEPLHIVSAAMARQGDYRLDTEEPVLWKYWSALLLRPGELDVADKFPPGGSQVASLWFVDELYAPTRDADRIVNQSRAMMLILGVLLGAVIAAWAWHLGGAVAATFAAAAYCLDPAFIAHASLVKNDVTYSLISLLTVIALWAVGRRATWLRLISLAVLLGVALTTKFSSCILVFTAAALMALRATSSRPWPFLYWTLTKRSTRLIALGASTLAIALISWACIWAAYGCRFRPTPDPASAVDTAPEISHSISSRFYEANHRLPTDDELQHAPVPLPIRVLLFLRTHHVFPDGWVSGVIRLYAFAQMWSAFLCGWHSDTGWFYYFPLAMIFKAPLATLIAATLAGIYGLALLMRRRRSAPRPAESSPWTARCLVIPASIYLAVAMSSHINVGIRHVLPIYPILFIAMGLAASRAWTARLQWLPVALLICLAAETITAFPHYLAFFNRAAGGPRGGLKLLADSNLDWGQDLPLLAAWRRAHPDVRLFLWYFGTAPPSHYGIAAEGLPRTLTGLGPAVVAVSATYLQGLYIEPPYYLDYHELIDAVPDESLGGTIYLFHLPLEPR